MVIQLLIGKQAFPITIKRDQEEIYRRASQLINEKLGRYEQSYPHLGYENTPLSHYSTLPYRCCNYRHNKTSRPTKTP